MLREIHTERAPEPVGPYAQAVVHGDTVYLSGQIALDPETGALRGNSIEAQAEQVLANLTAVLEAAGSGWERVLRVTIYLLDMADFPAVNEVYGRVLAGARPARATVAVAALPLGARVEMDAVAVASAP